MITYPIHEMFYTFQGEGAHMGKPAFFIRLFGCPVHCNYCDSAGTWHPRFIPKEIPRLFTEEIVNEVILRSPRMCRSTTVVLTGGEPAIHNLEPLTDDLHRAQFPVHLETSGGFSLRGSFDWVTVSPKKPAPLNRLTVSKANEFKLIIESPEDIAYYTQLLEEQGWEASSSVSIWLHPEWSHREDIKVLSAIVEAVKANRFRYRAGWQIHKLYQADAADGHSRLPVPLGGDAKKGY